MGAGANYNVELNIYQADEEPKTKKFDVCSWDPSVYVTNTRQCHWQERASSFKNVGTKTFCPSCIGRAMEVLVKSRACGQSHVSLYSLWVVPWGAVWLFWDNLLITIQYGPLEREPMEFPFSLLCQCEWTDYMSKSRHLLCPNLKSRGVQHLFCSFFTSFSFKSSCSSPNLLYLIMLFK